MRPYKANIGSPPGPELGDIQLALAFAQASIAALSNHSATVALAQAAGAAPYTAIAGSLTAKVSGKFLVTGYVTISANGGSLVDGDGLTLTIIRNGTGLTPIAATAASTATGNPAGSTICAYVPFSIIDVSGLAIGITATYGVQVTTSNSHTSGVIAGQGVLNILELPG